MQSEPPSALTCRAFSPPRPKDPHSVTPLVCLVSSCFSFLLTSLWNVYKAEAVGWNCLSKTAPPRLLQVYLKCCAGCFSPRPLRAPFHSARIEMCKTASRDRHTGKPHFLSFFSFSPSFPAFLHLPLPYSLPPSFFPLPSSSFCKFSDLKSKKEIMMWR